MALRRLQILSPNYSSRDGAHVRLIVLHSADGARTIESLGAFFQSSSVQVSSHVGSDDTPNTIGEYVRRGNKAWTQANFNPIAVSIEQCGFSYWDSPTWLRHPEMLMNTARWIAEEAEYFGIPIRRLTTAEAQLGRYGVCQHSDLGAAGGGHTDCGRGYPMNYVLDLARRYAYEKEKDSQMITSGVSAGGTLHVWWVEPNQRTIRYRFQYRNDTTWHDGGVFAVAPKDVGGISSALSRSGTLEVFVVYTDGVPAHTWQNQNESSWHGGKTGHTVAGLTDLPK